MKDNLKVLEQVKLHNLNYILIDENYEINI